MPWPRSLLLAASLLALASSLATDDLHYRIERAAVARVRVEGAFDVTYAPPLGAPITAKRSGASELTGWPAGGAVAEIDLPGSLAGDAARLRLAAFEAHADIDEAGLVIPDLFDGLLPRLPASPPIPLEGAALFVEVVDLELRLLGPLESGLIPCDEPNVYDWSGAAPLRIAGHLQLIVSLPGREPRRLASASFGSSASEGSLAGTFTGDATTTILVVGFEDAESKPDATAFAQPLTLDLAPLGALHVKPTSLRLVVDGSFPAVNREFGLPPGTTLVQASPTR